MLETRKLSAPSETCNICGRNLHIRSGGSKAFCLTNHKVKTSITK